MTAEKQAAVAAIEKKADLVAQVADEIWSFAELSLCLLYTSDAADEL